MLIFLEELPLDEEEVLPKRVKTVSVIEVSPLVARLDRGEQQSELECPQLKSIETLSISASNSAKTLSVVASRSLSVADETVMAGKSTMFFS